MSSNISVGTSGWNYPHWRPVFYPQDTPRKQWLNYYADFFNTVELNVTFYRLMAKKVFTEWYEKTPAKFLFVVKGSRFITHIKKLHDVEEPLKLFTDNVQGLKEKCAAMLWQLHHAQA